MRCLPGRSYPRVLRTGLSVLLAAAVAGSPVPCPAAEDDLARELPRINPLSPDEALKSFRLHEGFRLEPAATEPLVTDPVCACYDADGRLYVVEMRGYPYPEKSPTGYVRRIEDTDGDGRFDRGTIFVPGLSWPTSVVPYDGGVFIAVAPDILYAKDTDGDGVADVRKVAFTGFGTQNVQALVNGLLWGPDGWVYGVSGGNGGEIKNLLKPGSKPASVRGRDFRFRPDGSAFEAVSGGGQFGHSFDDWGHRFTCNNSNHIRQIVLPSHYLDRNPALIAPAVVDDIAAEGAAAPVYRISAAEPWRVVRTRQRVADPEYRRRLPATELVATGFFTSATGVTIYRGDAFAPEYRGNAFIGDVGGNLVHRKVLTKHGAEFLATRADQKTEFLASTDNWFRPVNFANTPDGTLLILDMYRETIEHPLSIPEPIKKHLDLTSGKDLGRLYHLVPDAVYRRRRPCLSGTKTADLVALLTDPAAWWRETAQRLLIERGDTSAVPALRDLARRRPNALGRVHALWTLDAMKALDDGVLAPAFDDPDPGVREQAARLSETHVGTLSAMNGRLLALADDPDPMVRFQAAFSIGALVPVDRKALDALVKIARKDAGDRWTRLAVMSSISRPRRALELLIKLELPGFPDRPEGRTWLDELSVLIGTENDPAAIQMALALYAGPGDRATQASAVVLGLGRGLQRAGGSLRAALTGPAGATLTAVLARAVEAAKKEGDDPARVDAIRLIGLGPVDQALDVLPPLTEPREPAAVQLAAVRALADLPDHRVGPVLIDRWKSLSPAVRGEAVEALFAHTDRLEALLAAIEAKAVPPSDLDPSRQKMLRDHPSAAVRARAVKLFNGQRPDRTAVIASFRPALSIQGDRDKGREVYRKVCATCHKAEGQGTDVGPNLATVTGRAPEDLLVHILDPNREVAPAYVNYNLATTDGRVLTGLIAEESAGAVTLKRAEGVTDVIPRGRIDEVRSTGLSLMPEGLEKDLRPKDLADLIAYVRGINTGPPAAATR